MPRLTIPSLLIGAVLSVTGSCRPSASLALHSAGPQLSKPSCQHGKRHCTAEHRRQANPLLICRHIKVSQLRALGPLHSGTHGGIHSFKDPWPCTLAFATQACRKAVLLLPSGKNMFLAGASAASAPRKLLQAFCVSEYSQCGGTTCPGGNCPASSDKAWACCQQSDFSCQRQNGWYWQCRPGSAAPAPAPASDTKGTIPRHDHSKFCGPVCLV